MSDDDPARHRRLRLRLGALLFRLRYYMQTPHDIAAAIYRFDDDTYLRVEDDDVHVVTSGREQVISLEAAIERCKKALAAGRAHP